jgi:hypothetical protein
MNNYKSSKKMQDNTIQESCFLNWSKPITVPFHKWLKNLSHIQICG